MNDYIIRMHKLPNWWGIPIYIRSIRFSFSLAHSLARLQYQITIKANSEKGANILYVVMFRLIYSHDPLNINYAVAFDEHVWNRPHPSLYRLLARSLPFILFLARSLCLSRSHSLIFSFDALKIACIERASHLCNLSSYLCAWCSVDTCLFGKVPNGIQSIRYIDRERQGGWPGERDRETEMVKEREREWETA